MTCRTKVGLVDRVTHAVRDHSCDVPIFGRTFFGRTLHQVGIVGSANRIHWSKYFGRTIFGRTFFGRIILQSETPKIGTSHEWSRTARVTRSTSPTLVRHVIERDGRKRRKKLLYAQKPYVYVRTKSLYAQKPYVYVHTKSLYAQKPYV